MTRKGTIIGDFSRRNFMLNSATIAGGVLLAPGLSLAQNFVEDSTSARVRSRTMIDKGPPVDEEMIFEFVHKSHFDLSVVRNLLAEEPQLIHATWDWGGGDFETGLGAASHMGNRKIAEFLIVQGARTNLFAVAMLGYLDIMRGLLEAFPNMIHTKGPHGLSLIHHAEKGGEEARPLLDYLKSFVPVTNSN